MPPLERCWPPARGTPGQSWPRRSAPTGSAWRRPRRTGRCGSGTPRRDGRSRRVTNATPARSPPWRTAQTGSWWPRRGEDATARRGGGEARRGLRPEDRQDLAVLHGHTGAVTDLAFAPAASRLASLSYATRLPGMEGDATARVWDVDPRASLPVLRGHTSYVYPVAYTADGRLIASGAWDGPLPLSDPATPPPAAPPPPPRPLPPPP